MEAPILKITAFTHDWELWRSAMESTRQIPKEEQIFSEGWYLHGELETIVGFDIAVPTNAVKLGYYAETVLNYISEPPRVCKQFCFDGLINVEVEGLNEPCLGIFYVIPTMFRSANGRMYPTWKQKGFVCLERDKAALAHAMACHHECEPCI